MTLLDQPQTEAVGAPPARTNPRWPATVAGVANSARLYAYGAVKTKVTLVHADRNTPGFMRLPPVVPYI